MKPTTATSAARRLARAVPDGTALELLRRMLRIRKIELAIEAEYQKDEMRTPIHLHIGQEAVPVGVCAALRPGDRVFGTHRSHGPYLAKGGSLKAMLAELYGRESGCSRARGGSMHLIDLEAGVMGTSAIVSGAIPLAVGAALASAFKRDGTVAVGFFGDAAAEEGVFFESMNFAALRRLPVLFVCENNLYSVCTHIEARQANPVVAMRARAFGLPAMRPDGTDALAVYAAARRAVERAAAGGGPTLLECPVYRWRAHAGAGDPLAERYRKPGEAERWLKRCPVELLKRKLLRRGLLTQEAFQELEALAGAEIADAFAYAKAEPFPRKEDVSLHLFHEGRAR